MVPTDHVCAHGPCWWRCLCPWTSLVLTMTWLVDWTLGFTHHHELLWRSLGSWLMLVTTTDLLCSPYLGVEGQGWGSEDPAHPTWLSPWLPAALPYRPVSLSFLSFSPACGRRVRWQVLTILRAKVDFAYNTEKPGINSYRKCITWYCVCPFHSCIGKSNHIGYSYIQIT